EKIGPPDRAGSEPVVGAERAEPPCERRRALDRVDGSPDAASQLEVERSLTRSDLEDLPTALHPEPIEERQGRRVPQPGLCAQPRGLAARVAEEVAVSAAHACRSVAVRSLHPRNHDPLSSARLSPSGVAGVRDLSMAPGHTRIDARVRPPVPWLQ